MDEIIYMNLETSPSLLLFVFFGTVTVITALSVIFQKNPVVSAVSLVFTFFSLAGIYGIMGALFIATMQVLVYAGAIMVLVVFVLMLLSQRAETMSRYRNHPIRLVLLSVFVLGFFSCYIRHSLQVFPIRNKWEKVMRIPSILFPYKEHPQ